MIKKEELIKLYIEEKKTQSEIGKIYNCDRKNVDYYLRKYEIPKRSRKESAANLKKLDIEKEDLLKKIESGMLVIDICKFYGVSRGTLYKFCKDNNLNFRNHKNQTSKQSLFMKNNNPLRDSKAREKAVKESSKTKRKEYKSKLSVFDENMTFKEYAKKSRYLASKNLTVNTGMEVDHIFSIKDGYNNKIPISIISDAKNLREISKNENLRKGYKSLISLKEFLCMVGVQRLSNME